MVLTLLLAGCGSDSGFDEDTDFVVGEGAVQFVNMIPDSMNVTMQHGIQNSLVRFPFAEAPETRFEDNYDWRVVFPNNANEAVEIIEGENQPVVENVLSTFLLMGTFDNPRVEVFDTPILADADRADGFADVWFASNVTYIDMVDIYLTENGADLAATAPTTTLNSGTFSSLIQVPAGENRQLRITVAGTDQILFNSGPMPIVNQSQELFALVDDFGPAGADHVDVIRSLSLSRSIMRDASQSGQTRIANYTTVAALDTTYGTSTVNDIAASSRSSYVNSGEGDTSYLASDDGTTLEESTLEATLGIFATIYNFDNVAADATSTTRSVLTRDVRRSVQRRALIKFVNGSDTTVDFYVLRGDQTVNNTSPFSNNVGFGASATSEIVIANTNFIVRDSSDNEELVRITETLTEGETYTFVFTPAGQLVSVQD